MDRMIDFFVDTNILIYILEKHPHPLIASIVKFSHAVSVISEIELLGKKNITPHEVNIARDLLNNCEVIELNNAIKETAIALKQKYSLKTSDAIIAATSKVFNLQLVTADKDFKKIKDIEVVLLNLQST